VNQELEALLQRDYRYAIEAQIADDAYAKRAREAGELARYFDLSQHVRLADLCWILERWEEAQHWYQHNARIMREGRAWHAKHSGPGYPIDAITNQEATALIKAGNLDAGWEHLRNAIDYWQSQPNNKLVLAELGLHAAQAGVTQTTPYALEIIQARQELPGDQGEAIRSARTLLHFEPSQVNLLLGRWEAFYREADRFVGVARQVEDGPGLAFPVAMQDALVATSQGLKTLASLHADEIDPERSRLEARQAFERAMLHFYQFSGFVDWNVYVMRLNTRCADELATGEPINPNPFSDN
jgi:tetratricopeptide (TPR) repeat protein